MNNFVRNFMKQKFVHTYWLHLLIASVLVVCGCGGGGGGGGGGKTPTPTPTPSTVNSIIESGGNSNCRIDSNNALACWGLNDAGQLGIGSSVTSTATPTGVNLGSGKTAKQVAIGVAHTCAILNDDSVSCWGSNSLGQLGQALTTLSSSSPVPVSGVTAKALALGLSHTCAIIAADNTVQCWGSNGKGQLGVATSAGIAASSSPLTISGLKAKSIQSGYDYICAIATDDTVQCWGDNQYGQLGNASTADSSVVVTATGLSGATHLTAGAYHTCASTASGISCWGQNSAGQLGSNGTSDQSSPTPTTTSLSGATQLAAGLDHTCALSAAGLECWGSNAYGQLSGSTTGGVGLVAVTLTNPTSVSAGSNHTCAQAGSDQTYCWGAGGSGRLGPNASADSATPVLVP